MPSSEFDALVLRRVAHRERQLTERAALRCEHVLRRVEGVICWPRGRICPVGRLAEAWVTHRHGPDVAAECGAPAAGPRSPSLARELARAIVLYEAFADQRPPGWPQTGPAALCTLAIQRRAAVLAGDVARLGVLAKAMRAIAMLRDEQRIARAAASARRRQHPASVRVVFRTGAARWESAEQRRRRVRDRLLLGGADPATWPNGALAAHAPELDERRQVQPELIGPDTHAELDGLGARAERYRSELANGRWAIPAAGPITPTHHPQEDTRA